MITINYYPNAFVLKPHHCKFHWTDNGSRWVFADKNFMRIREEVGLDTHVIHFHNQFHKEIVGEKTMIRSGPIIQFIELQDLVYFRLKI